MDRASFAESLAEHKDAVYGYAIALTGSVEDAEDVTQETFLALFGAGRDVPPERRRPWLLTVCRNACFDLRRRKSVRSRSAVAARVAMEHAWGLAAVRVAADDPCDASDAGRAARRIEAASEAHEVIEAMGALSELQRSALVLREIHDLPYREIAGVLGVTLGSVKVTIHRARRRLRELLAERT